jgi:hypothetical protein
MTFRELADVIQGTEEWHAQRRGMVTASAVGQLLTVGPPDALTIECPTCEAPIHGPCLSRSRKEPTPIKTIHDTRAAAASDLPALISTASNDTSRGLTLLLVAERITGYTDPTYMSDDMLRGLNDEPLAVYAYSKRYAEARTTGFMVRDDWGFSIGYSPDGVVGDDGLIEVKSRRQKKHLATILADEVPAENMAQLQAGLLVSGREWIDYVSYCGGMPLWRKRVTPDAAWCEAIVTAVLAFEETSEQMVADYGAATVGLAPTERLSNDLGLVF